MSERDGEVVAGLTGREDKQTLGTELFSGNASKRVGKRNWRVPPENGVLK